MNLTDILPELIRSARGIITSTAGIRQFEENCSDLQAGYPLDGQVVAAIATGSRALETALLRVEQALASIEAERRQLEAAFAALTSDDPEERTPKMVLRVAEEAPVVAAPPPVPVSTPADIPLASPAVAPVENKLKSEKKSSKNIERCKKCHKRKNCVCDKKP